MLNVVTIWRAARLAAKITNNTSPVGHMLERAAPVGVMLVSYSALAQAIAPQVFGCLKRSLCNRHN
jgi:hypothetical protein